MRIVLDSTRHIPAGTTYTYTDVSGVSRTIHGPGVAQVLLTEERRDPSRGMYQYRTSHDPRIRALERRVNSAQTKEERRSGKDRRLLTLTIYGINRRSKINRRKS